MTRTIPATQAKNNFGQLIREVYTTGEPVLIEKSGLPVVVMIPFAQFAAGPGPNAAVAAPRRVLPARRESQRLTRVNESR